MSSNAAERQAPVIASLLVATGGAIGSVGRYWATVLVGQALGGQFVWATIGINVLGSFAIGLVAALAAPGDNAELFLMVGVCGGFTTFSSFSLQTMGLAQSGAWLGAAANVLLSVALCLLAVTLGHLLASRA